jgi:Tol biopolymer transport system component
MVLLVALALGRVLPQEEEIVFSANLNNKDQEIYRLALNRQLSAILTRNTAEDSQPAWSADGQQIAFVSNREGQYTIYVMDAQGRNSHRLTDSPQNNFSPTWSPDERSIAYVTARQEFARQITEVLMTDLQSGITRRMTIPYPNAISPAWSPDSKSLTFTSGRTGSNDRVIYNLDLQTGDTAPLIAKKSSPLNPTWSPDGRYLLYLAYNAKPGMYLWDSTHAQSILLFAPNVLNMRTPDWSQDNRFIIYAPSTAIGNNSIFRLDVISCLQSKNACIPQPVTYKAGIYDSPRWRPPQS